MRTRIFIFFLLSATVVYGAEDWRSFQTTTSNVLFSVDEASLVRQGDVVTFWERLVYVVPEISDPITGRKIKEKRVHRVMNCKDRTQAHLYASQIADDGRRIEQVYHAPAQLEMTEVLPSTIAEEELSWACSARNRSG